MDAVNWRSPNYRVGLPARIDSDFMRIQIRSLDAGLSFRLDGLASWRRVSGVGQNPNSSQQVRWVYRLRENFEIMPVCAGVFKQLDGGGLTGEKQHFAVRAMLSHLRGQFDSG
jgi:hypothetical protein